MVQLYGRDVVGSVTRPVAQLLGYRRVHLEPGESRAGRRSPCRPTRLAFSDRDLTRVVEPGEVELWVGPVVRRPRDRGATTLTGPVHTVGLTSPRWTTVSVTV